MKKLLPLLLLLLSCSTDIKPGQTTYSTVGKNKDLFEIKYFKDTTTNLCFAQRGVESSYTFTCVPCDSLVEKRIKEQLEN